MTSAERVRAALRRHEGDRVPVDFGTTNVTGMHVSCVAALRRYYEMDNGPVKVIEPGAMLGEVADDLKRVLGIDTEGIARHASRYGFTLDNWKPFELNGLEVLVPGGFNVTTDGSGDLLMHPNGDVSLPAGARMPKGGYFFDPIIRQAPFDEDKLDPKDNLEEYGLISDAELDHLEKESYRAAATGRAVIANFGGSSFGDIALVPGAGLPYPKGIRDITEWYVSIRTRPDFVHKVFEGQCEIAIQNLERIAPRVGDRVDVINVCGTDFGTQKSSFCSVETFRELWMPYYKRINQWIHWHTKWRTFKHSCGAVEKFIDPFLEAGFDVLNPVQCSASGMEPEHLKRTYGSRLTFWGGGVDTQQTLPFGTPAQVREQVLRRCEIFAHNGGYVFNAIHNVQAGTPVENIVAAIDAVREFNGEFR
jgi:hypothetical protein